MRSCSPLPKATYTTLLPERRPLGATRRKNKSTATKASLRAFGCVTNGTGQLFATHARKSCVRYYQHSSPDSALTGARYSQRESFVKAYSRRTMQKIGSKNICCGVEKGSCQLHIRIIFIMYLQVSQNHKRIFKTKQLV